MRAAAHRREDPHLEAGAGTSAGRPGSRHGCWNRRGAFGLGSGLFFRQGLDKLLHRMNHTLLEEEAAQTKQDISYTAIEVSLWEHAEHAAVE